jgi:hypothetical protein
MLINIIFEIIFIILSYVVITDNEQLTLNISNIQMANTIRLYRLCSFMLNFNGEIYNLFILLIRKSLYCYQYFTNSIDYISKYIYNIIKKISIYIVARLL